MFEKWYDIGSTRHYSRCTFSTFCSTFDGRHKLSSNTFPLIIWMNCYWSNLRNSIVSYATYDSNNLLRQIFIYDKQQNLDSLKSPVALKSSTSILPSGFLWQPTYLLSASGRNLSADTCHIFCMQFQFSQFRFWRQHLSTQISDRNPSVGLSQQFSEVREEFGFHSWEKPRHFLPLIRIKTWVLLFMLNQYHIQLVTPISWFIKAKSLIILKDANVYGRTENFHSSIERCLNVWMIAKFLGLDYNIFKFI